ncbi:SIN3-HDAC complex-associated factor isoform X2 [Lingula anatina]|nr:SIN3-HDAC complex-associated factor isoform X2 [Lingula anatina]XP_013417777.1 SIN3-HDAC complex-associated factor isoform X2 [Lingula anatina]XP_013417778.1 SIN3-HDAC complex-associated factor isoform X2 [Lingula anatina]|eukprot:XP_013417776.1 SIN3-HDAC complex-associated factor isoform X2 [Lingula anatina]
MFNFHRPKTYRSLTGCCICGAKSSSSRFTDSKRYEADFQKCFRMHERRTGDICNACVLLVKRWKKLPAGTNRHWNHVVDARAGPGSRALMLRNKQQGPVSSPKKKKSLSKDTSRNKHKHKKKRRPRIDSGSNSEGVDEGYSETSGPPSVNRQSPELSESEDENSRDSTSKYRQLVSKLSPFLDLKYWKMTQVCCGIIFKGLNGEVMIDPSLLKPCAGCRASKTKKQTKEKGVEQTESMKTKEPQKMEQDDDEEDVVDDEMPHLEAEVPYTNHQKSKFELPLDLTYKSTPAFLQSGPVPLEAEI